MARSVVSTSSQYLEIPDDPRLDYGPGDLTICIWNRGTVVPANAANLLSKGTTLQVARTSSGKLRFNSSTPTTNAEYVLQGELSDNVWHHWVFERIVGVSTRIYLDGAQVAFVGNSAGDIDNTDPMRLGARSEGLADRFWDGQLAEFASFKRQLSLDEIKILASGFSPLFLRSLPEVYLPINGRFLPEIDPVSGLLATVNNAAAPTDGPRMRRPVASLMPHAPARFDVMAGTIEAVSQVSGKLVAAVDLAGGVNAISTVQGDTVADVLLQADIVHGSSVMAAVPLLADTPLKGTIAAQSSIAAAPLLADVSLSGSANGTATVTGDTVADVPLQVDVVQGSVVLAALRFLAETPLKGTVAAKGSIAVATLSADVPLSGAVNAKTTVAGNTIADVPMEATVSATAAIVGDTTSTVPLTGSIGAASASDAALSATVPLVGAIVGAQSTVTGDLVPKVPVAGSITATTSVAAGTMLVAVPVAGAIAAKATVAGDTVADVPLAGDVIAAQSILVGDIMPEVPLAGFIGATTTIAGELPVAAGLVGSVTGVSSLSGGDPFLAEVPMPATSDAAASLRARLRILGEVLTTSVGGRVKAVTSTGGRVVHKGGYSP